jgi:hypothetical protein
MPLMTKTFWKWDSKYDNDKFPIGTLASNQELEGVFDLESKEDNKYYWQKKDSPNLKIITSSNRIVQKFYTQGGQVEKLLIERDFQSIVESHIQEHLAPSSLNAPETKLVLCYIDAILSAILLLHH